jgi:integrase
MKGCRPLTDEEVKRVRRSFTGRYARRNESLVVLGVACGFRISEVLSLRVGDVLQHGKVVDRVTVARRYMKGGKAGKAESRTVRLAPEARAVLSVWLEQLAAQLQGALDPQTPVFCSRVRDQDTGLRRAISREQAWRVLTAVFAANELQGRLGTHCLRKTFANNVYEANHHDLPKTQKALGHRNINSTVAYLSFREEDVELAILAAASRTLAA